MPPLTPASLWWRGLRRYRRPHYKFVETSDDSGDSGTTGKICPYRVIPIAEWLGLGVMQR